MSDAPTKKDSDSDLEMRPEYDFSKGVRGKYASRFDELTEQVRFLKAVDAGLADSEAGRVHSQAQVVAHMKHRATRRKAP